MDPVKYLTDLGNYASEIVRDYNSREVGLSKNAEGAKELEKRTISIALRVFGSLAKAVSFVMGFREFALLLFVPAQASVLALFTCAISMILAHELAVVGNNMRPDIRKQASNLVDAAADRVRDAARIVQQGGLNTDSMAKAADALVADTPRELAGTILLRHLYPYAKQLAAYIIARAAANDNVPARQ